MRGRSPPARICPPPSMRHSGNSPRLTPGRCRRPLPGDRFAFGARRSRTDQEDAVQWLNEPAQWSEQGSDLIVTADAATDFWRVTGYGYVRDSGHLYGEV